MMKRLWQTMAVGVLAGLLLTALAGSENKTMNTNEPADQTRNTDFAVFGGGCFWCVEAVFERVKGVKAVVSGYAGGQTKNPTYQQVCSGETGHAEVVRIEFDPKQITLDQLLELFWHAHDPTTLNRQGPDAGTQYRSIVLYRDLAQKLAAENSKKLAAAEFTQPIVTEIVPLKEFYPAEAYHQDYFRLHPNQPYCAAIIRPKVDKLTQGGKIGAPAK
jgi:peptide-methionine (S)-S-oxide reductase